MHPASSIAIKSTLRPPPLGLVWIPVIWTAILFALLPLGSLVRVGGDEGTELGKAVHLLRAGSWDPRLWNDQPLTQTRWYAALLALHSGPLLPRAWSLFSFGILMLSVGGLTESLFGSRPAARWAQAVVAGSPICLDLGLSAMQEMPVTAWGVAAAACAVRWTRGGGTIWWWGAVACGGGAALVKLTGMVHAVSAWSLFVGRGSGSQGWVRREGVCAAVGAGLAGTALVSFGLWALDGRPMSQLLGSHLRSMEAVKSLPDGAFGAAFHGWIVHAWPVLALALLGIAPGGARWDHFGWRAWLIAAAPVLLAQTWIRPWWGYYAVSVVAVLAPGAGVALAEAVRARPTRERAVASGIVRIVEGLQRTAAGVVFIAMVLGALERLSQWHGAPRIEHSRLQKALGDLVREGPVGCLYAADSMDAFWAGMPVPPELLVVTEKRFLSGSLQRDEVPDRVRRAGCDFIVLPGGAAAFRGAAWDELLDQDYVRVLAAEGKELFAHRELHPTPAEPPLHW